MKIIRWVGGKDSHRHLPHMIPFPLTAATRYYEPFFGGGSMFFTLKPPDAVLGDINADLMSMWQMVRDQPNEISYILSNIKQDKETYYQIRDLYNSNHSDLITRAALFIYINRTNFRGLYRVNAKGKINMPYGHVNGAAIPDLATIQYYSEILKGATLRCGHYFETCNDIRPGDFAFFDPPYHSTHDSYAVDKFGEQGQYDLKQFLDYLDKRGVYWLMTNSNTELINQLYQNYHIQHKDTVQQIRIERTVKEVIVTNYPVVLQFV